MSQIRDADRSIRVRRIKGLKGEIVAPPDKSLTHRALMLAAIASGTSEISNPLQGEDCRATLKCLEMLGLQSQWLSQEIVRLTPISRWAQPTSNLYCGNSGTTMRLLAGLVASRQIEAVMTGDESLSRRPMQRIAAPLNLMGAMVEGDTPPLRISGRSPLHSIDFVSNVASAQVKSCVLLAGLRADGMVSVTEPYLSRDHTERMLTHLGASIVSKEVEAGRKVSLEPIDSLPCFSMTVPGDISSSAFFAVAAALVPGSEISIRRVGTNPTRTGLLEVFSQCGVDYSLSHEKAELGEPTATLHVRYTNGLRPFKIEGALVPRLIDEIPILAVLATQCDGASVIKDAREMRVKETDRIEAIGAGLRSMNAKVETRPDGLEIEGPSDLTASTINAADDHRIAMTFIVAGLIASGESVVCGAESISTSYPEFESHLKRLTS